MTAAHLAGLLLTTLTLYPVSGSGTPRAPFALCVTPQDARHDVAELEALLTFIPLPVDRSCRERRERGWFELAGGRVVFVIEPRQGKRTGRPVPWVDRPEGAISSLARRGKLPAFAILVLSILAQQRLALDAPPSGARRPPVSPRPPPVVAGDQPRPMAVTDETDKTDKTRRPRPVLPREAAPATVAARPPAGPSPIMAARSLPTAPRPSALTASAASGEANARVTGPAATLVAVASVATIAARRAPAPAVDRASSEARGVGVWIRRTLLERWALEAHCQASWRNFGAFAPQFGGGLHLGFLYFQAGYAPVARWQLENRPIDITAVTLSAGWVGRLWSTRRVGLRGQAGGVVDRLAVRRGDLTTSTERSYWEPGVRLATLLSLHLGRGLEAGLSLGLSWYPAARAVQVPDGPSGTFNNVSVQTGLVLLFGPRPRDGAWSARR